MYERRRVLELFERYSEETAERAAAGIERYRKGPATLSVRSADGTPLTGAQVTVRQVSHDFRYGANLFMLDELETEEKNELYKQYFADTFNIATLPFYWNATEPEEGKTRYEKTAPRLYRRPPIDLCMEFCLAHGIEPREHALAYEPFFPSWLRGASIPKVKTELRRRYREISERYAHLIPTIEVTNEMEWAEGCTAFYDAPDFIPFCFQLAEEYFPSNTLCINEHTPLCWGDRCRTTDKYYAYIEAAMAKGARIDSIGMQFHQFHRRENEYEKTRVMYDPRMLYRHMDLYAELGKPLHITEVTIPSYSWEAEDEKLQAEIIEQLYTIWFSHPAVEQIVYWNLVDGYAHVWNATDIAATQGNMTLGENYYHGGLLRFDMTPKPAYFKIKEMFEQRFHTCESHTSDADGVIAFRGFFGEYEVTVEEGGRTHSARLGLHKNGSAHFEIVV